MGSKRDPLRFGATRVLGMDSPITWDIPPVSVTIPHYPVVSTRTLQVYINSE